MRGRLEPQSPDREAHWCCSSPARQRRRDEPIDHSRRSRAISTATAASGIRRRTVTDYATARIRITVPSSLECVASGELEAGFPALLTDKDPARNRKIYVFTATQPVRYLAFIVSRFSRADTATIAFDGEGARINSAPAAAASTAA